MTTLRETLVQLLVDRGVNPLHAAETVNDVVKEIQSGLELVVCQQGLVALEDLRGYTLHGDEDGCVEVRHHCQEPGEGQLLGEDSAVHLRDVVQGIRWHRCRPTPQPAARPAPKLPIGTCPLVGNCRKPCVNEDECQRTAAASR